MNVSQKHDLGRRTLTDWRLEGMCRWLCCWGCRWRGGVSICQLWARCWRSRSELPGLRLQHREWREKIYEDTFSSRCMKVTKSFLDLPQNCMGSSLTHNASLSCLAIICPVQTWSLRLVDLLSVVDLYYSCGDAVRNRWWCKHHT